MTNRGETNQTGPWLSIREAALALGTSELTIRRRIKGGRLTSRLEAGKYFVQIGALPTDASSDTPANRAADRPPRSASRRQESRTVPTLAPGPIPAPDLKALFAEQRDLAETAARANLLEEQLRALETRYASLQDGALALANRNGWLEGKLEEREKEIKLLGDSRKKARWWRRVFVAGN